MTPNETTKIAQMQCAYEERIAKLEAELESIKLAIGKALDSATLGEAENILTSLL
jgi:hypothetical protein